LGGGGAEKGLDEEKGLDGPGEPGDGPPAAVGGPSAKAACAPKGLAAGGDAGGGESGRPSMSGGGMTVPWLRLW
jgi:hypothetical protein